jgi:hypothetical protein
VVNNHLFPMEMPDGTVFKTAEEYALFVAGEALRYAEPNRDGYAVYASAVRDRRHRQRVTKLADDLIYVASAYHFYNRHTLEDAFEEVLSHPC